MARIRTIKPEFWDSPDTGKASLRARLLFIAMWNWADDYGIGDATPIRLLGFAFPNDDISVSDFPLLGEEIAERFGVVFYEHEGRPFYYIPSWEEHQRTEKRAKQRVPFPHELENPEIPGFLKDAQKSVGNSATESRKLYGGNRGTGEQGNRGRRNRGTHSATDVAAAPADAVAETANDYPDEFETFWDSYGRKVGKGGAFKAWKRARKKAEPETITHAAAEHLAWHRRAGTEERFIPHPATWLNEERWNDERPEPRPERAKGDQRFLDGMTLAQRLAERERQPDTQLRQIGGTA